MGDEGTIAFLLQAHPPPQQCLLLHAQMICLGLDQRTYLVNLLLHRYAKSMEVSNAGLLFNKIHQRDVVSWNTMIGAYAHAHAPAQGERFHAQKAAYGVLQMPRSAQESTVSSRQALQHAQESTDSSLQHAQESTDSSLQHAQESTDSSLQHAQESSNHAGHMTHHPGHVPHRPEHLPHLAQAPAHHHSPQDAPYPAQEETHHVGKAIEMLTQMVSEGVDPDRVTFIICLKACSRAASLVEGELIHTFAVGTGHDTDVMVATGLIDMYGQCQDVDRAKVVFDKVSDSAHDAAAYNSLMGAFVKRGCHKEALGLFSQMQARGVEPNAITFINALSACIGPEQLAMGRSIHACISGELLDSNAVLRNALMTMYGKCGDPANARAMFGEMERRTVVSWTSMINECTRQGCDREALDYFYQMQGQGVEPDMVAFISALSACAALESVVEGKEIHALVTQKGFELDVVIGTALVNMYGKCKLLNDALATFHNIARQTVISWNAIITAHAQQGFGREALELLWEMEQDKDMEPDKVTFVSALTACACIGALDEGIAIHNRIIDHGFESDFFIGNAIVNMYGKCAALQKAQLFFDTMPKRNVVTWTSLITAYAHQGHGSEALSLYRRMQEEKVMPNSTTFLSLISACGHAGLVGEALFYFASMTDEHGIEPKYEHYGSMVDLLGKAGLLSEAEDFIQKMPMEADACIWISLLGACRMHGDMERAKRAAEKLAFLEGSNASPFILLFNMYASDGTENMPQLKKDNGKERTSVGTRIRKM